SDSVEALSTARILTLRAERDESLALVARGGGDVYLADFDAVSRALGRSPDRALLAELTEVAQQGGSTGTVGRYIATLGRYGALHARIVTLETNGEFSRAIALAAGPRSRESLLASRMNGVLSAGIVSAQSRFERAAGSASSDVAGLRLGIALLVVAAAALAVGGYRQRIAEYR